MRDKYDLERDSSYSGSGILINLLNIKDQHELAEAKIGFIAERYRTYESQQLLNPSWFFLVVLRQLLLQLLVNNQMCLPQ